MKKSSTVASFYFLIFTLAAIGGNDVKSGSKAWLWITDMMKLDVCANRPFKISLRDYVDPEIANVTFSEIKEAAPPTVPHPVPCPHPAPGGGVGAVPSPVKVAEDGTLTGVVSAFLDEPKKLRVRARYDEPTEYFYDDATITLNPIECKPAAAPK